MSDPTRYTARNGVLYEHNSLVKQVCLSADVVEASAYDAKVMELQATLDSAVKMAQGDTALVMKGLNQMGEQPAKTCGKAYATIIDAQTGEPLGIAWCQKDPGHPPPCGPKEE